MNASIQRDTQGIILNIKSELFEEHWRSLTKGGNAQYLLNDGNHKYYLPQNPPMQTMTDATGRHRGWSVTAEPTHGLFHGERINLAYLRLVGISAGGTVRITNAVYSTERLKEWLERFREGAKLYYLQVMKPVSIEVEITTREI